MTPAQRDDIPTAAHSLQTVDSNENRTPRVVGRYVFI